MIAGFFSRGVFGVKEVSKGFAGGIYGREILEKSADAMDWIYSRWWGSSGVRIFLVPMIMRSIWLRDICQLRRSARKRRIKGEYKYLYLEGIRN